MYGTDLILHKKSVGQWIVHIHTRHGDTKSYVCVCAHMYICTCMSWDTHIEYMKSFHSLTHAHSRTHTYTHQVCEGAGKLEAMIHVRNKLGFPPERTVSVV